MKKKYFFLSYKNKKILLLCCFIYFVCRFISIKIFADDFSDYNAAYKMFDNGLFDASKSEFLKIYNNSQNLNIKIKSYFYYAESLFFSGEYKAAKNIYVNYLENYKLTDFSEKVRLRIADCELQDGNYKNSAALYLSFLKQNKTSKLLPQAYYYLAESLYKNEKYLEATTYFEKLIKDYSASQYNEISVYSAGISFYKAKNYNKAINYFNSYLEKYKNSSEAGEINYYLGNLYFDQENYSRAIKYLNNSSASNDLELKYYSLIKIIDCLDKEKKYNDAIKTCNEILKLKIPDEDKNKVSIKTAELYYKDNRLDLSEKEYKKIKEKLKNNELINETDVALGYIFILKKDYDAAIKILNKIITGKIKNNKYYEGLLLTGIAYYNLNDFENANLELSKIQPVFEDKNLVQKTYYYMALCSLKMGNKDPIKYFIQAINILPDSVFARNSKLEIANYYFEKKDYISAIKNYQEFCNKYSNDEKKIDAVTGILSSLFLSGKYDELINATQNFLKESKNKDEAGMLKMYIPKAYLEMKKYSSAYIELKKICATEYKKEIKYEAYYYLLLTLSKQEKYLDTIKEYELIRNSVEDIAYKNKLLLIVGNAYFKISEYEKAIIELNEIVIKDDTENPYYMKAVYLIMDSYYNLKNFQKAIEICDSVMLKIKDKNEKIKLEIKKGWLLISNGEEFQGIEIFDTVINETKAQKIENNDLNNLFFKLGEYFYSKNDLVKAKDYFKEAFSRNNEIDSLYWLAMTCIKIKDYDEAIKYFKNIVELKNNNYFHEAIFRGAEAYIQLNRYKEAYDLVSKVEKFDGSDDFLPEIILLKIFITKKLNMEIDKNQAINILETKYKNSEAMIEYLRNEAEEKIKEKNMEIAVQLLNKAINISNSMNSFNARMLLAGIYEIKKDYPNAVVEYLRIAYSELDDKKLSNEALFRAAQMYEKEGNIKEAKKVYQKVVDLRNTEWEKASEKKLEELKNK